LVQCKVPVITTFYWILNFLNGFKKKKKYSNVKFHENPSSRSRVVPCGRTDRPTDRQTDMTKPIVAFRNFCERA